MIGREGANVTLAASVSANAVPNAWAGGTWVCVPAVGVGRMIQCAYPRVIEIDLPAPTAAVFVVREESGPLAVVLVDPRMPDDRRRAVIEEARELERAAVVGALSGSGPAPKSPGPQLRVIHSERIVGQHPYEIERVGR